VPGLAVAETVRRADEAGRAIEEVDRSGLWTAQTPQAFRRQVLERARRAAGDRSFTDDAAAVIALNEDVRLVPGERRNFKLTSVEDVAYARELAEKGLVAIVAQPLPR
jgi:2-C-methyl-D-erythritol 4-phosphate cytidylyltransferase